jgi:hypothetical protein
MGIIRANLNRHIVNHLALTCSLQSARFRDAPVAIPDTSAFRHAYL